MVDPRSVSTWNWKFQGSQTNLGQFGRYTKCHKGVCLFQQLFPPAVLTQNYFPQNNIVELLNLPVAHHSFIYVGAHWIISSDSFFYLLSVWYVIETMPNTEGTVEIKHNPYLQITCSKAGPLNSLPHICDGEYFVNFNVHRNFLRLLLKCGFWFSGSLRLN